MAKSLRTAFIRVSQINETQEGMVTYNFEDIKRQLVDYAKTNDIVYWAVYHNEENPHFHIVIKFPAPVQFGTLKNRFPYGNIESARNIKSTVQYLIHANSPSKKQYTWNDVFTNCDDMSKYMVETQATQSIKLDDIIRRIESGEIRRYEKFDKIPMTIWAKNKTVIMNAFTHQEGKGMASDRNITVMFIQGKAGTGKTTLAKFLTESLKLSYIVSSSSNDPMQDYEGQKALILDDLRDSVFTFTDLLKILDNHTNSSMSSRYSNKHFIGDLIIITSSKSVGEWYQGIADEDRKQFFRRINAIYEISDDGEYIKAAVTVNEETGIPKFELKYPNMAKKTLEERRKKAFQVFEVLEIEPIEDLTADNKTVKDVEQSQMKMDEWQKKQAKK